MDQSCVVNDGVSSPTSPKIPPPLPPNPPRSLPPGAGRRTSASLSSPTQEQLPQLDTYPACPTAAISRSAPPRPVPPDLQRVSSSGASGSSGAAVAGQMAFTVCLRSTPGRQLSGSLLGIGRRDAMLHSTEVKTDDGTVYRRNRSGVYFQVEQAWTSDDGSAGLEVGDEVLAVDNYNMVDMSLDTAR